MQDLVSIWSSISLQEHSYFILEGLPSDYHQVISIIESKFEPQPIAHVEALLLVHESRLMKFQKDSLVDSPLINYTHVNPKSHGSDYSMLNKTFHQSKLESFGQFCHFEGQIELGSQNLCTLIIRHEFGLCFM